MTNDFSVEYRKINWSTGAKEELTFEDYYFRLSGTRVADQDKNCPARCWLRAMDAERAEELGV